MAQPINRVQDVALAGWIQKGSGLVEQQEARVTRQGAGDGQALLLSTTESVNRTGPQAGQSELFEKLLNPCEPSCGCGLRVEPQQQIAVAAWE